MAKYTISSKTLKAIADMIRTKTGTTAPVYVSDFATKIESIESREGLFAPDGTFTSWNELVEGGKITVEGNAITKADATLSGRLNIPYGITEIGLRAFENCSGITNIVIPYSVTSIRNFAFSVCKNLTSIAIPDSVTSIGKGAFGGCASLTSIVIPDGVTSIEDFAFSNCTSLASVEIPNSVTSIGDFSFRDCTSLENIVFHGTNEQWNAIAKEENWNIGAREFEVICTDSVLEITENGTYDVSKYASVIVNISGGGGTPDTPTYNGYIPLGKYVFSANPNGENLDLGEQYDEENDEYWTYPDWFTTIDSEGELRTCFGVYCSSDSEEAECYYNPDFMDFLIGDGTEVTVITEIEVTEEQYNAFMYYFTFVGTVEPEEPDTPTYNGYIPKGTYLFANEVEPMDGCFPIGRDFVWFSTNNMDIRGATMELYEGSADCFDVLGENSWSIGRGNTIEVLDDLEATETEFNEFMKVFAPQ